MLTQAEHVELLLDAYALEFHALSSQLTLVQKEIEATEDVLTLQLDVARNNLWKVPYNSSRLHTLVA